MSTKRRYRNPPIAEALCEIHFEEGPKWNSTFFGLFHEKIRDEFPETQEMQGLELGVQARPEGPVQHFRKVGIRMRFGREDKTALVQLSENLLAINVLPKYPGWHNFKPLILARLKDYVSVIQPKGIVRIGLRYINRISFPEAEFQFDRFFARSSYLPVVAYDAKGPFLVRLELPRRDGNRLNLTIVTHAQPLEPGHVPVVVDLDHIAFRRLDPTDAAETDAVLEDGHSQIISAFESIIGDELRRGFGPED